MSKEEKEISLDGLLASINKQFGEGSIMTEDSRIEIKKCSYGNLGLDIASGGGFGIGTWVEIFGEESTGKTTNGIYMMIEQQKMFPDKAVCLIDAENSFDINYARSLGLDTSSKKFIISQPDYGEQAINIAEQVIESGLVSFIMMDSIAAMQPKKIIEGDAESETMGAHAKMMAKACVKLKAKSKRNEVSMLWINQIRNKITMFGNPETVTGGYAPKFYMEQRIRLGVNATAAVTDKGRVDVKAKFIKNKISSPHGQCEYSLNFGEGLDTVHDLYEAAKATGFIQVSGRTHTLDGVVLGTSKDAAYAVFVDQVDVHEPLREQVVKYLQDPNNYGRD